MLRKVHVPAPHGRLEALLEVDEDAPPVAAAVVCHPHPKLGGNMHNVVVHRTAKALARARIATLRFNFRGVGSSTGAYDGGPGEEQDVAAALDHLATVVPGVPLWAAGFSFGARHGLGAGARDGRVERLLAVGLVPALFDFGFLADVPVPKAFVQGGEDELAYLDDVWNVVARAAPPRWLEVVDRASHMFTGQLSRLEVALDRAVGWLLEPSPADALPHRPGVGAAG